jgi:uncharacterized protein YndB with AHSA1/START domain
MEAGAARPTPRRSSTNPSPALKKLSPGDIVPVVNLVTVRVPRSPTDCWRLFTDVATLTAWVPGLRRAQTLAMSHGLPSEVHFEFSDSLVYTLVYTYDVEHREVRWQPKLGRRDGVTGYVRFEADGDGTQVTYALEHGAGREASERELGDLGKLAEAFVAWMQAAR